MNLQEWIAYLFVVGVIIMVCACAVSYAYHILNSEDCINCGELHHPDHTHLCSYTKEDDHS
jgi:hypothetical protein